MVDIMSNILSTDFLVEVAKGNVAGHSLVHKFGRNSAVGTTFVPVAIGGIYQVPQAASATTLRVKAGGDVNDTAAGSGARQIMLEGLDETATEATETLATAGASASSATTTTFMRLYRFYVSESGTYATATTGSHSGDIVIENGAGGTDWGTISSTGFPRSQSEVGVYSVPTGKTAYILGADIATDSSKTTNLLLFQRTSILDAAAPYDAMRVIIEEAAEGGKTVYSPRSPQKIAGPTDVGFMAKVDAGTAEVNVDIELLIVDD